MNLRLMGIILSMFACKASIDKDEQASLSDLSTQQDENPLETNEDTSTETEETDSNTSTDSGDQDDDGYPTEDDCNDQDPLVHPNANEVPYDGIDNDCDPTTHDDDIDQDGYNLDEDCDDQNAAISPSEDEERYDGIDNDCDPTTRDDDIDQDGYNLDEDCDDFAYYINPSEIDDSCDNIDNNCDGNIDEAWSGDTLEPNDITPNDFGELTSDEQINVEGWISTETDIDSFMVYLNDTWWSPDFGLYVELTSVPNSMDLAISIDFIDQDGTLHSNIATTDEAGLGEGESIDYQGGLLNSETGNYIVRVYAVSGRSCQESYTLSLIEGGLL